MKNFHIYCFVNKKGVRKSGKSEKSERKNNTRILKFDKLKCTLMAHAALTVQFSNFTTFQQNQSTFLLASVK